MREVCGGVGDGEARGHGAVLDWVLGCGPVCGGGGGEGEGPVGEEGWVRGVVRRGWIACLLACLRLMGGRFAVVVGMAAPFFLSFLPFLQGIVRLVRSGGHAWHTSLYLHGLDEANRLSIREIIVA